MSRRTVRHLTAAVALVLALSLAGPARAAAGPFETTVPAVQPSNWLDLFVSWFSSFWGDNATASVDKSTTTTVPVDPTGGDGSTTSATTSGTGSREQGGAIDPDG